MKFDDFYKKRPSVETYEGFSMPEHKPSRDELAQEGERMERRVDWWQVPTYTQAVDAQRKAAEDAAKRDVNRAKRVRDAALITDMADVLTRMFAQRGGNGAWIAPQVQNRAGVFSEAYNNALRRRDDIVADYGGKIALAKMQDYLEKKKQLAADKEYVLALNKAQREQQQQEYKNQIELMRLAHNQAELAYRQKKDEDDRKSREKIAKERNESYERGRAYSYGARGVKEIDLGGGQFIEVDKNKWSTPNKSAIAGIVKQAIINEMSQGEKQMFEGFGLIPVSLQSKYGFKDGSDMTTDKLFDKWRDFEDAQNYVKRYYGVNSDSDDDEEDYEVYVRGETLNDKEDFTEYKR